jgi:hypothetical protein
VFDAGAEDSLTDGAQVTLFDPAVPGDRVFYADPRDRTLSRGQSPKTSGARQLGGAAGGHLVFFGEGKRLSAGGLRARNQGGKGEDCGGDDGELGLHDWRGMLSAWLVDVRTIDGDCLRTWP